MKLRVLFALMFAASVLTACPEGDPATEVNNIFIPPEEDADTPDAGGDDGGTTMDGGSMNDMGSADAGMDMELGPCDLVRCLPSQDCEEGICIDRLPCSSAIDAGTLALDVPSSVQGSFLETGSDAFTASCGEDGQLEQLVRFEVTERSLVTWSVDWGAQFDGLVALQTTCDDPQSETECSDVENSSALLDAGEYFLVLEVRLGNPGTFDVELTASAPPVCTVGAATCNGDDRDVCVDGFNVTTQACPLTCSSGACAGDSCAAPITVTAPGGTFSGDGQAMTSTLDYATNTDCAELAGMATTTPGYDVVFYLPNLMPGQVVSIDARTNDGNVNDIFVQQTCGDTNQCTASYQNGEQPDFVVQTAGDYFVIIEKRQASNAPFEYSISIQ